MDNTIARQKALDDELVAPANRLKIGKSNLRLSSDPKSKEPTLQVAFDALKLTSFYNAFVISADVPEIYMQEFWVTVSRYHSSLRFKLNGKSHTINVDTFRDILKICPIVPGQRFEELPLEEAILSFIRDLGHTREIKFLSDVNVNHMHQPWRSLAAIINKCLSKKTTALENLRLSRAQILWGMYHNKKVDYAYLLWEDLVFQVENKNSKKNNDMYYPRFTKVIVDYFMAKDQAIPRRNKMFWHHARDDFMFTTVRVISKHHDTQVYGAILPQHLTNQAMLESEAYKTYHAYATGEKTPRPKSTKKKADSESSPKTKSTQAPKGKRIKTSDKQSAAKSKGLTVLSEAALSEADQLKLATKRSKKEFHSSHASGSGDEVDIQSKVPDEQQQNVSGGNQGRMMMIRKDEHDSDNNNEENDSENDNDDEDDDQENDSKETESDDDGDDFVHPNLSTYNADDQEEGNDEERENDDDEIPDEEDNQEDDDQDLVAKFINPTPDTGIDSILNLNVQSDNLVNVSASITTEMPFDTTIPQPSLPIIQPLQQTHDSTTTTPIPTTSVPEIPNFASLFDFERRYLDNRMNKVVKVAVQIQSNRLRKEAQDENDEFLKQINSNINAIIKDQTSYAAVASLSEFELKKILIDKIKENKSMHRSEVQKNLYNALIESYNSDKDIFGSYGDVKESKSTSSSRGASRSQPPSSGKSAQEDEHGPRGDNLEEPFHQEFNTDSQTPDSEWYKTKTVDDRPPQSWMTQLAQASGTQSSFNEFLATPIDFSAFVMNRLKIKNLTQDVLTGPTYELMKGTCKSVVELEYHLEDVFKATNDQLDWHNPEGRPYPHDLSKPLPLIQNATGRQVIPFDYFINNDLEYLKGGSSSKKYTASITKTKAADYGHVQWIEDKDDQLYKFREGDFKRLRRQDIEDMLLLLVQGKLTNLNLDERFGLNVALRMYTRQIVIQERVEDLQLAVESYQKKINLSKPDTYRSDLQKMTPYTAYYDIQGIIYQDDMNRNHLMRTDELHKFSDSTLNHVCTTLNDIATGIQMDYLPKRK
ncbi:hypothetical protein Tco_0031617 [Tanacetum coccineum]